MTLPGKRADRPTGAPRPRILPAGFDPRIHTLSDRDRWEEKGVDLPDTRSSGDGIRAVMLGAGLSAAARQGSLSWKGLVRGVSEELHEDFDEKQEPRIIAMALSWRFGRLPATADETEFQSAVAAVVRRLWSENREIDGRLCDSVGRLILSSGCSLILDLNYDPAAEVLLEQARVPFYRIVGAQIDVAPPLPDDTVLLWKIHGSIDYPPTIVLSPTEYQRIYETNELGAALMTLGGELDLLWTLGVGLTDDDVWTYLCSPASAFEIIALRLSRETTADEVRRGIEPWGQVVGASAERITVFAGPRPASPSEAQLADRLTNVLDLLEHGRRRPGAGGRRWRLREEIEARYAKFDRQYRAAHESARLAAIYPLLEEFRPDYDNLCHTLLTKTSKGSGHRWMPALTSGECLLDDDLLRRVGDDLAEVICNTRQCFTDHVKAPACGFLVAAAAQYVMQYVLDLMVILGVRHEVVHDWPSDGQGLHLPRKREILVGADPFFFGEPKGRFNLFHFFTTEEQMAIRHPVWGPAGEDPDREVGEGRKPALLGEDEWEAQVVDLYCRSEAELRLGDRRFDLTWAPPIYPWGFGFAGLKAYRGETGGTVTKAWHLVSGHVETGTQICKGGSLRDQSTEAFMIARRGKVRIGEYDDFVQRAFR